ncbi:hypothetical protein RJD39_03580 [Vibrio scophthalmi]|uniref:3-demethylubiquinone-9 3-methyltransferase n=2 Tax=Vibrio scophthalmi TaxID=45658 RepID=F9RTL8_9VIBR|nr:MULTISPECIES: hypothetical protein [Vibrio]EGU30907.1 hypothetical protein VIS19158_13442 [Vibrio scophthalmi LMG 19158]EGU31692.1 hypothetical protein VIBRN418_17888 [Vibrio sp. N418]MCY9804913.1 hypothetical protein [Vibrio scophthalmi]ODS11578.1 hypothetical protein VSF3289_01845 [Vibrio scophthalmi]
METMLLQLRKDFYSHISSLQAHTLPQSKPTLSVLTDDELKELEHVWVELSVWQRSQAH